MQVRRKCFERMPQQNWMCDHAHARNVFRLPIGSATVQAGKQAVEFGRAGFRQGLRGAAWPDFVSASGRPCLPAKLANASRLQRFAYCFVGLYLPINRGTTDVKSSGYSGTWSCSLMSIMHVVTPQPGLAVVLSSAQVPSEP